MITNERATLETAPPIVLPQTQRPERPEPAPVEVSVAMIRRLLRRLALVFVGFGIAMLGFSLMLTVFLVFIGLPLFIVGVAIMQAQESDTTDGRIRREEPMSDPSRSRPSAARPPARRSRRPDLGTLPVPSTPVHQPLRATSTTTGSL